MPPGRRPLAGLAARRRLPDACPAGGNLVPMLYPRTQSNSDGVWQMASARRHLADGVCQTVWQRCLPDAPSARQSGRGPSGRRHLADAVCQTRCLQGVCQTPRLPDSLAEGHLADGIWQTQCLADGVCKVPSARRHLPDSPLPDCLADPASGRHLCQTPSELV